VVDLGAFLEGFARCGFRGMWTAEMVHSGHIEGFERLKGFWVATDSSILGMTVNGPWKAAIGVPGLPLVRVPGNAIPYLIWLVTAGAFTGVLGREPVAD
jgi:hypothetical protein